MAQVKLTAEPRSEFGKGAARRLRRSGRVPAVIYGEGASLTHVSLDEHELDLALSKPQVVLEIAFEGATHLTKPRDVQREPVRRYLEHVDLIVLTKAQARERGELADAIKAAEEAAAEAGIDPGAAAQAVYDAVAAGEDPMAAAQHAVEDVEHQAEAYAEESAAAEAHEAEEAAEAAGGEADES